MSLPPLEPLPDGLPSSSPLSLSEPLLTATDVSLLLGIPRSSVHDYAKRADDPLPAVRIGRHRRFYRSEVERWLAGARRDAHESSRLPSGRVR
ncbi:MAG: helix-turn-helix domain-containing protein [Actinobacteria bacterium]|nr:helix-turn-helix domain-containing protein [Actinomycetota bacterium]